MSIKTVLTIERMRRNHPGFSSVAKSISKRSGVSMARASAILTSSSMHASSAAKRANPRLKRVGGYVRNHRM